MQTLIVWCIVVLAVGYLARTLFGRKQTDDACGGGCSGCAMGCACDGAPRNPDRLHPPHGDRSV